MTWLPDAYLTGSVDYINHPDQLRLVVTPIGDAGNPLPVSIAGGVNIGSASFEIGTVDQGRPGASSGSWFVTLTGSTPRGDQGDPLFVTGTLALASAISVTFSGSILTDQGLSGSTFWKITGSVGLSGPITGSVSVTEPVTVNQGLSGSIPWLITGSIGLTSPITGAIKLTEPITGSVSITEPVVVIQGQSGSDFWKITGSVALAGPVTGSVGISEPVTVNQGLSGSEYWKVTGSVSLSAPVEVTGTVAVTIVSGSFSVSVGAVDQGLSGSTFWKVTGSVNLSSPITGSVSITEPVVVNQGLSGSSPWLITGSIRLSGPITGSVGITNPLTGTFALSEPITGSVSITEPVVVNQGLSGSHAWLFTGSVALTGPITGSVGVTNFPAVQAVTGTVGLSGPITGTVGISGPLTGTFGLSGPITGAVKLTEAVQVIQASGTTPWAITGSVGLSGPITGTVGLSGPVAISNFPATQNVTGSNWIQTVSQGPVASGSSPWNITGSVGLSGPITGSVGISGPVAVSNFPATQVISASNWVPTITGSVVLAAAPTVNQGTNPWIVSGSNWIPTVTGTLALSAPITGSVGLTGPITGSVSITSPVTVMQGTSPWIISGSNWRPEVVIVSSSVSLSVTGSVATTPFAINASIGLIVGKILNGGAAANTLVPIRYTTYNEQLVNARRSMSSTSALDSSGSTGARKVKVTYYDQSLVGPKTETIVMNGTASVNTVNTDICFIEKMEVTNVGSTLTNQGTITLFVASNGASGTIGTITTGIGVDGRTFWAHHYVAVNLTASLATIIGGTQGNQNAEMFLKVENPLAGDAYEEQLSDSITAGLNSPSAVRALGVPIRVFGPARVVMYEIPAGNNTKFFGSFDYSEI